MTYPRLAATTIVVALAAASAEQELTATYRGYTLGVLVEAGARNKPAFRP